MNSSTDIRFLLDRLESIENGELVLNEGMLQKLAGLALGAVLALGPKVGQADTVFSYLDPSTNKMETVMDMSKVPSDAKVVMAVDTDTNQVMMLKGGPKGQEIKPDQASVKQVQQSDEIPASNNLEKQTVDRSTLYGDYKLGMSVEDVIKISRGKTVKKGPDILTHTGKLADRENIKVKLEGTPLGKGETYFQFDQGGKLVGIHYTIPISGLGANKDLNKIIKKGSNLFGGFSTADLGRVFAVAYDSVKGVAGNIQGKPKLRGGDAGSGMTLGVGGVASSGNKALGIGIPMDKVGSQTVVADTDKGYVGMIVSTQSGMLNQFVPLIMVVGVMSKDALPTEFEIER